MIKDGCDHKQSWSCDDYKKGIISTNKNRKENYEKSRYFLYYYDL